MKRVHLLITGEVQGVGFRYSMQAIAERAGAGGWVRNRRDGRVEAEVEGSPEAVDAVTTWARTGPPAGHVDGLEVTEVAPLGIAAFEVRTTR